MQFQFVKNAISWATKNQTVIKAVLAGVGVVTTGVTAARAGYKAREIVEEREELVGEEILFTDKARLTWPLFVAPFVSGAASIFCIYSGTHTSLKNLATVSALYSASRQDLKMTKEAIAELEGPKKLIKVVDKVNEKKEEAATNKEVVITNEGETIIFDAFSGRYMKSDLEKVRANVNLINKDVVQEGWACLNDFFFLNHLEELPIGDDMGWTVDNLLDVTFTSKLMANGKPCVVMSYEVCPRSFLY